MRSHDTLIDGQKPPFVIPFCASCDMPVELFTVYAAPEEGFFEAEAQCHGKTTGVKMLRARMDIAARGGEKLVLFQRQEGFDSVR